MNKKKYPKFEEYDFPGYEEITGDELYRINGGGNDNSQAYAYWKAKSCC